MQVYIKDTKNVDSSTSDGSAESVSTTPVSAIGNTIIVKPESSQMDQLPIYALQLPTNIVPNNKQKTSKLEMDIDSKISTNTSSTNSFNQFPTFSVNTINLSAIKTVQSNTQKLSNEMLNNVLVNTNGEVINIGHLVDLESVISQNQNKKIDKSKKKVSMPNKEDILKIDLTNAQDTINTVNCDTGTVKYDKILHVKDSDTNKLTYNIKANNDKSQIQPNSTENSSVVYNPVSAQYNSFNNFGTNTSNTIFYSQNINLNTTSLSADNLTGNSNTISNTTTATTAEGSTVNINVLNNHQVSPSNFQSRQNSTYSNISAIPVTSVEDKKIFVQTVINSVPQNIETVSNTSSLNTTSVGSTANITKKENYNGNNEKSHVCEICLKSFKRREHLYQHVKLHTGFRPFVCEYCNKAFMRKEHLLRHMTLHSGQKNFTCNICDKSFSRNDNLLKHKKTHEKQTSYECEVCLKTFVIKHYYVAHKMTHNVNSVWDMLKT